MNLSKLGIYSSLLSQFIQFWKDPSSGRGQSHWAVPEKCFGNRGDEAMDRAKNHGLWPWLVRFSDFFTVFV